MEDILIVGAGGHAKVVFDIIMKQGKYNVKAFTSSNKELKTFMGLPHFHEDDMVALKCKKGLVAIGDNFTRSEVVKQVLKKIPDFVFVTAVHPSAQIALDVSLGGGSVVMANVAVNTASKIGSHCILNTGCNIDHDAKIGDFASMAPGCTLGGNVSVGDGTAIGLGANIIHGMQLGQQTVVGAGALILENVSDFVVCYGVPARVIKTRKASDRYL